MVDTSCHQLVQRELQNASLNTTVRIFAHQWLRFQSRPAPAESSNPSSPPIVLPIFHVFLEALRQTMPMLMAVGALTLELRCFAFNYPQFVLFRGLFSCLGGHILAERVTHVSGVHRNRHRMACRGVAAPFESFLFFSSHIVVYDDVTRYIAEQKSEYKTHSAPCSSRPLPWSRQRPLFVSFSCLFQRSLPTPHPRQHISTRNDGCCGHVLHVAGVGYSVLSFVRP